MLSQTRRQPIRSQPSSSGPARMPLQWPASMAINLLIAGAIGLLYSLLVLGPAQLDPTHLSWLGGDAATYYIGWELFRQDPHLRWPLTFTDRLGYPLGDSIAFMDPIPLLSLMLKPLSPLLPTSFQYLGIATVLAVSLQFFFAARLFLLLLGRHVVGVLLPSLFFLIAPPMTFRLVGHYALANHWLLIAALCLYVSLQKASGGQDRKHFFFCGLLGGVAVGVNPYLAFMVVILVSASVITAWCGNRVGSKTACGMLAATAGACLISGLAFGLIRSDGGYGAVDYRNYAMNVLAPIDPGGFGGVFLRSMPLSPYPTSEGYNYLGAGILMLAVMLLPSFLNSRMRRLRAAEVVPLAVACMLLTALALSTKISIGSVLVVDIDPHETLAKYLSALRGSARLFWAPYYVILTVILAKAFTLWRPRKAAVLCSLALLVQFVDTIPLRRLVHEAVSQSWPQPLHSPQWSSLGKDHANLLVLPAWQCDADTPGGPDGYRIFGLLAVSQHMRINSYYAARHSPASRAFHCHQAVKDLLTKPLSPDSVYVVSPTLARTIAAGPTEPDACRTLDGFILCSTKTDFGLGPSASLEASPVDVPIMDASGHIESWSDAKQSGYFVGDWHDVSADEIWSQSHGLLQFRLTPDQRRQYHAVSLRLMVPLGVNGVRYRIESNGHVAAGAFPGSAVPRVEAFELQVPLGDTTDGIVKILFITQDPVRPVDIGLYNDTRIFGLGVRGVTLIP
jgi:Family of unknown function (DUF6311)